MVARAEDVGNGELLLNWYRILVWGGEKDLEMVVVMTAQQCECT